MPGNRKALLIGVENYGEGFGPLPAVKEDVRLVAKALRTSGYEINFCKTDILADATKLDKTIRDFCTDGSDDDIRIVYFSGHGILADGVDCIVPFGTSRHDAATSPNQRVSTDLSSTVSRSKTGLVLFLIDACRDHSDVPVSKGSSGWGDPKNMIRPDEHRFIRFFGCAPNQVCQVTSSASSELASSLFTRSFAECIAEGNAVSLDEILPLINRRCSEILAEDPLLQDQSPRLSYGELSDAKQLTLRKVIFDTTNSPALASVWKDFDPNKLHCLVVSSEYEINSSPEWGLTDLINDAFSGHTGGEIWAAFRRTASDVKLVSGEQRKPPARFSSASVSIGAFSVVDAFSSGSSLDAAIRAIVEADLVIFDVTGFEPAAMLLLGVRSASRRWLTVCSHGGGWKEGQPIELPFNLQDLSINSHSPRESRFGADPVVERFVSRIVTGFEQAAKQPRYLDLPAYDALRELGSEYSASSTIDLSDSILVLCAYEDSFFRNWQYVSSQLKQALFAGSDLSPQISRIIDVGTTQLVRQSIYEKIRRTAACVVDWSEFSPSVFLELGTRLAVSEWGAVQLIDDQYTRNGVKASKLTQITKMSLILEPIVYSREGFPDAFAEVASALLDRNPNLDGELNYNRVHRALMSAIGTIQPMHLPVTDELQRNADALHHPKQGRIGAPQILFHGNRRAKQDSEFAALEMRIAAWLYLEHRVGSSKITGNRELLKSYQELGRQVADALYDVGDDDSFQLAIQIEESLSTKE